MHLRLIRCPSKGHFHTLTMEKFLLFTLVLTLFFLSTKCCLMSGSGECLMNRLSFGGRMMLANQDQPSQWMDQRVFIFQKPGFFDKTKTMRSMLGHVGVGRIRMGKRDTCHSSNSESHCPIAESVPCLDTSIPCYIEIPNCVPNDFIVSSITSSGVTIELAPGNGTATGFKLEYRKETLSNWSYEEFDDTNSHRLEGLDEGTTYELRIILKYGNTYDSPSEVQSVTIPCKDLKVVLTLSSLSKRAGKASVEANWSYDDPSVPCRVVSQTISVQQLNMDNCSKLMNRDINVTDIGIDERSFSLKKRNAHSLFNVILTVVTTTNTYKNESTMYSIETAPTGSPRKIKQATHSMARAMAVRWNSTLCGQRNGDVIKYEYTINHIGQGRSMSYHTSRNFAMFRPLGTDGFEFKVRAVTSQGPGPYSKTYLYGAEK